MQIKIYKNFAKKKNSTKQPAAATATTVTVQLKDNTSFYAPVFLLTNPDPDTNYCYAWTNYYYVTDIIFVSGNMYELYCHIDVLASWRTAIGNSTQYVLRCSHSGDYNTWLTDTLYPTTSNVTYDYVAVDNPLTAARMGLGTFVVGVINNDTSAAAVGAVRYYVMTHTGFDYFMNKMLTYDEDGGIYGAWTDVGSNTMKAIFNPFQYVVSCHWFPFEVYPAHTNLTSMKFGWWEISGFTSGNLWAITSSPKIDKTPIVFNVPAHPQQARGKYLGGSPYSRYALYVAPFGYIPLDANLVAKASTIRCMITVDVITGYSSMDIVVDGTNINSVRKCFGTCGVEIQLAQISQNALHTVVEALNTVSTATGAISNIVKSATPVGIAKSVLGGQTTAEAVTGGIAGIASGIESTVNSLAPQMETRGDNSTWLTSITGPAYLYCQFFEVVDDNVEHRGKPLCADRVINTIPGYILCADVEFDVAGTEIEREEIKALMEGGFFYE